MTVHRRYESEQDDNFVSTLVFLVLGLGLIVGTIALYAGERSACESRGGQLVVTAHHQRLCLSKDVLR
jgi:hypothetical protein